MGVSSSPVACNMVIQYKKKAEHSPKITKNLIKSHQQSTSWNITTSQNLSIIIYHYLSVYLSI